MNAQERADFYLEQPEEEEMHIAGNPMDLHQCPSCGHPTKTRYRLHVGPDGIIDYHCVYENDTGADTKHSRATLRTYREF